MNLNRRIIITFIKNWKIRLIIIMFIEIGNFDLIIIVFIVVMNKKESSLKPG